MNFHRLFNIAVMTPEILPLLLEHNDLQALFK